MPKRYRLMAYHHKNERKWHTRLECPDGQTIAPPDRVEGHGDPEDKCEWCANRDVLRSADDPDYYGGGQQSE